MMLKMKRILNFLSRLFVRVAHVFEHVTCDEVPDADWEEVKEE